MGENVISVTVTAIDNTTQVYTVTVPRASLAQVSGLAVAPGGVSAPLYPTFSAATQAYTMSVVSYERDHRVGGGHGSVRQRPDQRRGRAGRRR